jgi:large subunit ribosomal protein L20
MARKYGLSYGQLICKFKRSNIHLNRKMLSQLAIVDAATFGKLVNAIENTN